MIGFIKRCSKYLKGELTIDEADRLWMEAIADGRKYDLLMIYLLLYAYMKNRPK